MSRFQAAAASTALAAALAAVAFGARGGSALERTGTVELLVVLAGAAMVCAALLLAPRGRIHGAWAVAAFGALALVTALSVTWSIAPDASYVETGRTLAYLAAFAGAVAAARLAPNAAPVVVHGILLTAVAVAAYGLAARVWPGSFDENTLGARIGLPFDYWNALAGAAAVGVVPALWLGTRRTGGALGRALAYPATGLLIATILIAQSRGALVGAAIACAVWLAVVPLRLRSLVVLGAGAIGAAPVAAWALSKDPFRDGGQTLAAREAVAGDFGLLLLTMLVGLLAVGLVSGAVQARAGMSVRRRTRTGMAIAAVAAVAALGLLTSVATSDRGLTGTVSDRVGDVTNGSTAPPTGGARLGSTSSTRGGYWEEAWSAFEERPLAGLGAGSFELARLRYRDDGFNVRHAHGFVPQTLSDLGIAGMVAALALLAAWTVATLQATGLGPRRRSGRPPWTTERAALVALALAAVAYGVQSLVDWTWFVPGLTAMAFVAAGFVAGRGPLPGAGVPDVGASTRDTGRSPARAVAAIAVALTALLCAWTIWQPVAADRAVARSYELLDEGRPEAALEEAEQARDHDGYSNDPLYAKATALTALGREPAAFAALVQAAREHPRDPQPLLRIASFQLHTLDAPESALDTVNAAFGRAPYSQAVVSVRDRVLDELVARGDLPPLSESPQPPETP